MSAALQTFAAILKEFYLGPIQTQLNNEVLAVQLFEKQSVEWSGRVCVIPVHTGRNTAVAYAAEGANLPAMGAAGTGTEQSFADLRVNAALLYGRFQVTGPAIASAKKGSAHSFISYSDAEMGKLVNDIKTVANQACYSGGRVVGFLNERKAGAVGVGVSDRWDFTGDIDKLNIIAATITAAAGGPGPGLDTRLEIVGMDRYENVGIPGETWELDSGVFTNGVDVANSQLQIVTASVGAGAINLDTTIYNAGSPSVAAGAAAPTAVNTGFAVVISAVQANVAKIAAVAGLDAQSEGIYGNLGSQVLFGQDRRDTIPALVPVLANNRSSTLQSTVLTVPDFAGNVPQLRAAFPGLPGTVGTGALNLRRMQAMLDTVLTDSGTEPNWIIMHPSQRLGYILNLQGTLQTIVAQGSGKTTGEGGFGGGLSYAGIPIKTDRHCARGGLVYLKTDTWSMLELQDGGFADLDGSVLARVANQDNWEGFYRWYYNVVCKQPFKNGILVGAQL